MRQFRFGVQISSLTNGVDELVGLARRAEHLGYSAIFLPDHLAGDQWSKIAALGAIGAATTSIKIGALVFCNDYRHPLLLAQELATLHELSRGRVEFGIGAGWMKSDYEQSGIGFDSARTRIARLREALLIVKELFETRRSSFSGEYYQLADARMPPAGAFGRPGLIVGGGGPKMLELAAGMADIVGINVNLASGSLGAELVAEVGPEAFDQRIAWVRQAAGDHFEELELQCLTFVAKVSADARSWVTEMAPAFGVSGLDALEIPIVLAGSVGEVCETLQSRRARFGLSYWVIHQHELDDFAPVVAELAGR